MTIFGGLPLPYLSFGAFAVITLLLVCRFDRKRP